MRVIKVDSRCYLVEWKYKDFLRIGHQFQGATIIRLERQEQLGSDYIRVTVETTEYKI
jgi:hypothetical protein